MNAGPWTVGEGVLITSRAMAGSSDGMFEIAADAQGPRALGAWFMQKDSPSLHSTVSSHSLEQGPLGSGLSLQVVSVPCIRSEAAPGLTPCPARGRGHVCSSCWWGWE